MADELLTRLRTLVQNMPEDSGSQPPEKSNCRVFIEEVCPKSVRLSRILDFFESFPGLLLICDPKNDLWITNAAWESGLGWSEVEVQALQFRLFHQDDRKSLLTSIDKVMDHGHDAITAQVQHKDGGYRHVTWWARRSGLFFHLVGEIQEDS